MSKKFASSLLSLLAIMAVSAQTTPATQDLTDLGQPTSIITTVRLTTSQNPTTDFSEGQLCIDDKTYDIDLRLRGASSLSKQKKSFALKLKDPLGDKLNESLLGMREDNYWILDAMAIDVARMRNRVSMDLWNDFSRKTYVAEKEEGMRNGTRGQFVELYLNDEYWGLYCLTERMDRKQLKLKKFDEKGVRGVLYKSISWSTLYAEEESFYTFDNTSNNWNGWEMAYPDVEDGEPINWQPLADLIHWLSFADSDETAAMLPERIDTPVWQDYFLMMELMCAEDNICKNQYVYFYNAAKEPCKAGVAPWDMDRSWGRDHRGKITERTGPSHSIEPSRNRVCQQLEAHEDLLELSFAERYAELREEAFSADALKGRFHTYFDLFAQSGAAARETQRWSGVDDITLDFDQEQTYIDAWIDDRLAFMDAKYYYTDGIGVIPMQRPVNASYSIFDLQGKRVATSFATMSSLPNGIYIVNGKKVIR